MVSTQPAPAQPSAAPLLAPAPQRAPINDDLMQLADTYRAELQERDAASPNTLHAIIHQARLIAARLSLITDHSALQPADVVRLLNSRPTNPTDALTWPPLTALPAILAIRSETHHHFVRQYCRYAMLCIGKILYSLNPQSSLQDMLWRQVAALWGRWIFDNISTQCILQSVNAIVRALPTATNFNCVQAFLDLILPFLQLGTHGAHTEAPAPQPLPVPTAGDPLLQSLNALFLNTILAIRRAAQHTDDVNILIRFLRLTLERLLREYNAGVTTYDAVQATVICVANAIKPTTPPAAVPPASPSPPSLRRPQPLRPRTRIKKPSRKNPRDCDICCVEMKIPRPRISATCRHPRDTCANCVRSHVRAEVDRGRGGRVRCPASACRSVLQHNEVRRVCDDATFARYDEQLVRATLLAQPEFRWCSRPDCESGQLTNADDGPIMRCHACQWRTCVRHRVPWHSDVTCEEYDANSNESPLLVTERIQKCPKCNNGIEKTGGCNHMTCRRDVGGCGAEFCWLCLADYKGPNGIFKVGNKAHKPDCHFYR